MEIKKLRRLPIGVQTFKKMREGDYVYVDKTRYAYELAAQEGYYFLSRPRRFGKSLFLSTLHELYAGNRALFQGLWIEDKWDWSRTNPVIHLSFAQMGYRTLGLEKAIVYELKLLGTHYGISYTTDSHSLQFRELIAHLHEKQGKVVLLIDEYDKPIIDYLERGTIAQAKENQGIMKAFYSVLKDAENHVQFLFITGVSKFSKVSIFSDLNHLTDLTLNPHYSEIVGYTQGELETNFDAYIEATMRSLAIGRERLLALIREWYNGFSWDGTNRLYNPFGILNFFGNGVFRNYWFITGMPTFLVKMMREKGVFEFESQKVSDVSLEKYDLDHLDIVAVMFQTGYLTVREYDLMTGDMVLDYPNREVRDGMYQFILDDLRQRQNGDSSGITVNDLSKAFVRNDLKAVETIINTLFGDLPAPLYEPEGMDKKRGMLLSERFFHGIIHLVFKYLGIFIESEVWTSTGRADSVVQTPTHVYIFEFKYNRSAKAAMDQLLKKGYAEKYRTTNKALVGIAVNFSHVTRRINGWIIKYL